MAVQHSIRSVQPPPYTMAQDVSGKPVVPNWKDYGIHHLAVIPDGNRRWARGRSLPAMVGHTTGLLEVLPMLVEGLTARRVHTVTAWGFSTENWSRARAEIKHLMKIFADFIEHRLLDLADEHQGRVVHMGRKDRLPGKVLSRIEHIEKVTRNNKRHVYNMAIDYGGEDELKRATERLLTAQREGREASSSSLLDFLDTAGQLYPNPDLIVRSSGEFRTSGFMPLQSSYSELFFVPQQFPEFTMELLDSVAREFSDRKRRFGK